MNNPFTLSFGKKPLQYISRLTQTNEILENFQSEYPSSQVYMITGIRGSGKTVLMSTIADTLREEKDWIVVELNPERDLLQSLAGHLYGIPELHAMFLSAKLDLSAFGLGVHIENAAPISDIEAALTAMLKEIKKSGKKLLIEIDEAVSNPYIRVFAGSFQIFIRQDLPVFLLMTGLYENIFELQNEKTLTFLYRAPKIILEPLNMASVRNSYIRAFGAEIGKAEEMAELTKGYPFAFQVLGYLCWDQKEKALEQILPEYDQYLDEYVYSKIWSEMSELDRRILHEMSKSGETETKKIREKVGMTSGQFSVYRDRLKRRGVVDARQYGHLSLILPRFDVFVENQNMNQRG